LILLALSRAQKKKEAVGPDAFYLKEKRSVESIGRIRRIMRVLNVLGKKREKGARKQGLPEARKGEKILLIVPPLRKCMLH
jgi:hypothetical protein